MNKNGPIVYIEDDEDDVDFLISAVKKLNIKNDIILYKNGSDAYTGLNHQNIDPFFILSDINMPVMNGLRLRDKMQSEGEIRLRTVPFIFLTTGAPEYNIMKAYIDSVQGFFLKPTSFEELVSMLRKIFDYWLLCKEAVFFSEK